jgi:hypothetical protein
VIMTFTGNGQWRFCFYIINIFLADLLYYTIQGSYEICSTVEGCDMWHLEARDYFQGKLKDISSNGERTTYTHFGRITSYKTCTELEG